MYTHLNVVHIYFLTQQSAHHSIIEKLS